MKHRRTIGVLRGGPSNEYEVSLRSGAAVLDVLRKNYEDRYHVRDIFIDRSGAWHVDGLEVPPHEAVAGIDFIWNALHGAYGEDGKVQSFLESHGMPFSGSGSLASAVGMNKALSKKAFSDHGIKTPYWKELSAERVDRDLPGLTHELFHTVILPVIVKPAGSGSSVGVTLVKAYADLPAALQRAREHDDVILIEEFIPGREATVGIVDGFRDADRYALPAVEIRHAKDFFDYEAKYAGASEEIVPSTFTPKIKGELEALAKKVHQVLGLRHYSRTDFIIHPRRGIYVLEVNTLPGLTPESLVPKALRAVGSDLHEFVDHVIRLEIE